ncbi:MAG: TerD family protein [Rhodospirillales bacterium]|nr:TerD family protein [Alphaproteobacteria bacterium]MCB9981663.1 TerD family protein [Rhodospirillales bacterium]
MAPRIPKGQSAPLNVTQEGRQRVFVGLGWDPNESTSIKDKTLSKLGLKNIHHDLDLSCYLYDQNKRYINHVSVEKGHEVDQTGQIYHSGDNVKGVGEGDDEQISVELKNLDPAITSIIFKASIKSGHTFDEVAAPEIRLVDAYSGRIFLELSLQDGNESNRPVFVFAALLKATDGGWNILHIGKFIDVPTDVHWAETLKSYI